MLNATQEMSIRLGGDGIGRMTITAYVDASYEVHWDFKSHTGCMISVTQGPVDVSSQKQGLTTKSSTAAELVKGKRCFDTGFLDEGLSWTSYRQARQSIHYGAGQSGLHRRLATSGSDTSGSMTGSLVETLC